MKLTKRLANESAREYALRMLRDNIISLELVPGTSASVYELSAQLGISRTPVREALLELNKTGIIAVYPQQGNVISYIDFEAAKEACFLRRAVERTILESICNEIEEEAIRELEFNISVQEMAARGGHSERLLRLDNEFHLKFFQIAKMERLYYIKDSLYIHFDRIRTLSLNAMEDDRIIREHHQVLNALKNKDVGLVLDAIDGHLSGCSPEEQDRLRRSYPEYFES